VFATDISLKFSGSLYISTTATAVYSKLDGVIQIGGLLGNNAYVNLVVSNVKVGTFDLSNGNATLSFANGTNAPDTFVSNSGSLVITQFTSTEIVGTFQFTGTNSSNVTMSITEGRFLTSYLTQ